MPLRRRGDRTGKIENAAQEIPLPLAREEGRDARNQPATSGQCLAGWSQEASVLESSMRVCQPAPCRRKAVCQLLAMHVVWTPQFPHRSMNSVANAWGDAGAEANFPSSARASHPGLRGHAA